MFTFITDQSKFWKSSQAAAEIYRYLGEHPELAGWTFEKALIAFSGCPALAIFTPASGKGQLTISAMLEDDGSWSVQHRITEKPPR